MCKSGVNLIFNVSLQKEYSLHVLKTNKTNKEHHQWLKDLVHSDFNLDRRVNLNSGDATNNIHRTINKC